MCDLRAPAAGEAARPGELQEADFRGCRFINGPSTPLRPGMFCCAPTAPGSSWCPLHRRIVWAYRRSTLRPVRKSPKPPLN
jgi:hypothetical protein